MRSVVVALLLVPVAAHAEDPPAEQTEAPTEEPTNEELAEQIEELEQRQNELERAKRSSVAMRREIDDLKFLRRFINVYVDVGAFAVGGDGSGIRSDIGHVYYPQYMGKVPGQWVFMGDPLSTAINSLGEPSDTSNSREVPIDTVDSEGHPSLLVNAIGLSIGKYVGHDLSRPSRNCCHAPTTTSSISSSRRLPTGVPSVKARCGSAPARSTVCSASNIALRTHRYGSASPRR
jgi:hypothetical protein